MKITELSLRRPLGSMLVFAILSLIGLLALTKLKLDLFPKIDLPIIAVITSYPGAGPEEVETIVSRPLESAIETVPNIKSTSSTSSSGNSMVMAETNYGADLDIISLTMRERIDLLKAALPSDVGAPMVVKFDPAMMPIMLLTVGGGGNLEATTRIVTDTVIPRLKRISGVASATINGGLVREFRVEVDQNRLLAYNLTLAQIEGTLRSENLNYPGGITRQGRTELLVRSLGEFKSLADLRDLPLSLPRGGVIPLSEVAEVVDDYQERTQLTRINGRPGLSISLQKESDANTVVVARAIRKELGALDAELGKKFNHRVVMDQGEQIQKNIDNVKNNALLGALLAIAILWLFLRNLGSTMVIGLSIPISIVVTFALLYFNKMTLNLISLGGLALGVGMLVDNSIVVLENIFRYRQEGADLQTAARAGASEVGMAILGSTTTSIVVFLPVLFVEGLAGQIFRDMAFTVGFSLLASLVVALTVVPVLSSKLLAISERRHHLAEYRQGWLWRGYSRLLGYAVARRRLVIVLGIAAFIVGFFPFGLGLRTDFMSAGQTGQFQINLRLPNGRILTETDRLCREFEGFLAGIPEVDSVTTVVGSASTMGMGYGDSRSTGRASMAVVLKPADRLRVTEVMEKVRAFARQMPDLVTEVTESSFMAGGFGGGSPIQVEISGPDLAVLADLSQRVKEMVASVKGTRQVKTSLEDGAPEVQLAINRERAAAFGISAAQIGSALRTAYQGTVPTRLRQAGEEYDVRVIFNQKDRIRLEDLRNLLLLSPRGNLVPLGDVAAITIREGPTSVQRKNQTRVVTVSAALYGRDLGSVSAEIGRKLKALKPPAQYTVAQGGQTLNMTESFGSLGTAGIIAILLVYLVLAIQYESLLNPLVIMFSIPLMIFGVTWSLLLTGRPLNVPGLIGVIMLAGIVVNNAIVLIDYVETLHRRGLSRVEAVLKAGPTRLRPVLMTTLTTILGVLPLALGIGEGAELEAPLATVIMGGLTCSTVLTLVVVPVVYLVLHGVRDRIRSMFGRGRVAVQS